ncbi:MAG: UDP-N-acetylmuramate--L-alanine ligase [Spirochaetaceae bacterium]|jgi:UDP-N-acetylmuramate--alanine ligase|nr:UDP-N-acetylmuramate--L-alanine ligase [Spirochaetaceae bacterium]
MEIAKTMRAGRTVYVVGVKGTGACALAELLHNSGVRVSGSDRDEVFYTDGILRELGIPYYESFDPSHIRPETDLVIYSAAYSPETNPELREARNRGIPLLKYPDALGAYSGLFDSSGIAGVHGKTTTTAMAGALIRGAGLPAQVLAGSAVSGFGAGANRSSGASTLNLGNKYFVAETCEYRRHFLAFHPRRIVLTSVEWDHQDFFPTYQSIRDAFLEYAAKLPPGGGLFFCADNPGAGETAEAAARTGRGIRLVPYGFTAPGPFGITDYHVSGERLTVRLRGGIPGRSFPAEFRLRVPGRHNALNAAAALALTDSLVRDEFGEDGWTKERREKARRALEEFRGSRRRSEILGEYGGVLFMDDYGHHPTAVKTTLEGLREFYPRRRIVVSFMSHTYTRTAALLDAFAASFGAADLLFLHKIYASAREDYTGGVTGKSLFEQVLAGRSPQDGVYYHEEPLDAAETLKKTLRPGDLFLTMGAGDNWKLGRLLADYYRDERAGNAGRDQ